MSLKSLSNKAKGKHPIIEDDDSNFAPPVTKLDRPPLKKESKSNEAEKSSFPEIKKGKKQAYEILKRVTILDLGSDVKAPLRVVKTEDC
uniref:Uncharacterized protein n=1 Tax=Cannabis sativa TaxID=3483 RepID=A0A803PXX3_CANSA